MKYEVKIPAAGESVTEATIGKWVKKTGEAVKMNDIMLVLETDKASLEVVAENEGMITIIVPEGKTVPIGTVIATIDSEAKGTVVSTSAPAPAPSPASVSPPPPPPPHSKINTHLSPAVQKMVTEKNVDTATIAGTGPRGRITKEDVMKVPASPAPTTSQAPRPSGLKPQRREPMSTIRKRIAERLVMSQQTTATLTTFNEVDLSKIMSLRANYKDKFKEKYGVSLGFMGFFLKASVEALKAWPAVNAFIEGTDIVYNDYYNIGVAVGTEKGLIVPVIRNVENLSIAQIELAIRDFALKARDGKISIDDLSGGTFTVSNGGVYGSLMSTPILNPPQSAILGMHKIEDRAVVINGKVEVRPMMYLAVSYDHRIIDGKEAVSFLVKIKEGLEDPERLLLEI